MDWSQRIENYERATKLPQSLFIGGTGQVLGTWVLGSSFGTDGDYPSGYVRRVRSLFPDKQHVLHVYSDGRKDLAGDYAKHLPSLLNKPLENYDLVLCDPPYTKENSDRHGRPKTQRTKLLRAFGERLREGAHVVWLDQVMPTARRDLLEVEALVGMVKSAQHRFRLVTIYRKI
jgi:hypothetical protein